ncbi:Signal transduction histidine kinase [Ruminococcaceae bacterium YAD3003]|nr:Signal transduction histidine kinase [Ruminococcaceae bacterium YAD3003]
MAQYKHSKLVGFKFTDPDTHSRTFGGTMLTFIFALIIMMVMAGILSIVITYANEHPTNYSKEGALILSEDLATGGIYSDHIPGGWTFVPNVSPEIVKSSLSNAPSQSLDGNVSNWPSSELLKDRAYLDNVGVSDSWRGWFDYNNASDWHNAPNGIEYHPFNINGTDCYCAAYIGHFECSPDIRSLTLTFHRFNGVAWVYNNGNLMERIGANWPGFNLNAFADYCTLIPQDGKIDLVIVIACDSDVTNPGIISDPIIGTAASNDARTSVTGGHFAIVIVLSIVAIAVVSNIILTSTRNKWLFVFFLLSFASILFYYLADARFLSVNSHTRADLRFILIVVTSIASYVENSLFFIGTKTRNKYLFLRRGHFVVLGIGTLLMAAYYFFSLVYGVLAPEFVAIMFALSTVMLSIFVDLFFYNKESQRSLLFALLFSLMFFVLFLAILLDNMIASMIPVYSNLFAVFAIAAEIALVSSYINQQREIKRSAAVLKRQVREKTVFISEINRDLVLTNKKLLEGEAARKNVLSNVSHDLRTPITAIRGYAELMINAQDNFTLEQRNSYLANIVRRSEQMERIVSDIMELTRMESSETEFQFTSVSIAEMLDELVMMYSMDLEDTKKNLSLDLPMRDSLIVKADPAKLSRVFENLISNAINYTGPEAEIVIKAWRTGETKNIATQKIHISVEDNGIGIPEQDIPRIFDRFYRAHNSGVNIKGTGLGLAIVKLICDKHDAEINVTSTLGKGTKFEVVLAASY